MTNTINEGQYGNSNNICNSINNKNNIDGYDN